MALPIAAEQPTSIRVATFAAPLSRDGPGLLLRDLGREDPQIDAIIAVIDAVSPDILVLTDIDFDAGGHALSALSARLNEPYPHHFTALPNSGMQTNFDLDQNGFKGDPRDAMGYGRFLGDGGMAVLSRYPLDIENMTDHTPLLWTDLPGAMMPTLDGAPFWPEEIIEGLRLSSTAHWQIPILLPDAQTVTLLAYSATPPVFDGPEDANGLRNRDELRLWDVVLGGNDPPTNPIVIGNSNLDPADGQGDSAAMAAFLDRPDLQDPFPASAGGQEAADPSHMGNPAHDTVDWPEDGPGNLRVSYVIPGAALTVLEAGVYWPADTATSPLGEDGLAAGPHRLVWVDLALSNSR